MFSPALPGTETVPHARLSPPVWQALENDSLQVHARKIGFHWQKVLRPVLLGLVLLWGAGTLLSPVRQPHPNLAGPGYGPGCR